MIAWWMAQLALLGSLLAIAAFGAEAALRIARRPTRWVWAAAIGLTLALGALAPMRLSSGDAAGHDWSATAAVGAGAATERSVGVLALASERWTAAASWAGALVQSAWSVWHRVTPAGVESALLMLWLVASLALGIAFLSVHARFRRRRQQWPVGTVRGTRVRIAPDTGPAVVGVTDTEIVVPQWLLSRDEREQQLVLDHELEHVRERDPLLLTVLQSAVILLPWNPAVWWMASRLRLAIELDCDRRVLQRGASARDYGTLLIDLTDHRTGFGAALPAFSCTPSHLERRLIAMTPQRLKYPVARLIATGAFASLALLAACEATLPTAQQMDDMTASSATAAVGRVVRLDSATTAYVVDGRPASKAEAEAIGAARIASAYVVTSDSAKGGEVRIRTVTGRNLDSTATATILRRSETSARVGFTGLMVVDGVITDPAIVNDLSPDRIASVEIVKGASAMALYSDPRAANGVILITTKKAKP